jgi:hypothetical protein
MMTHSLPISGVEAKQLLQKQVIDAIECRHEGEHLVLDTPYVVGDGSFLRAFLIRDDSCVNVSDGGAAAREIERFARSASGLRARYKEMQRIAERHGLRWDGDFYFTAEDLETAIKRLPVLAIALDEAQALTVARSLRLDQTIKRELQTAIHKSGFKVEKDSEIEVPDRDRPVIVDLQAFGLAKPAAIEILASPTEGGARIQVESAITNFHTLRNKNYQGLLVGVYDEQSPAALSKFRQEFESAKPKDAVLIPSAEATDFLLDFLQKAA